MILKIYEGMVDWQFMYSHRPWVEKVSRMNTYVCTYGKVPGYKYIDTYIINENLTEVQPKGGAKNKTMERI